MTATRIPIMVQLDLALECLRRRSEDVASEPASMAHDIKVARLYELEARLWSVLFEQAETRLMWRAALAAEAHARLWARYWRNRAAGTSNPVEPARRTGGAA